MGEVHFSWKLVIVLACVALVAQVASLYTHMVIRSADRRVAYLRSFEILRIETAGSMSGYRAVYSLGGSGELVAWSTRKGERRVILSKASVDRLVGLVAVSALRSDRTAEELRRLGGIHDVGQVHVTSRLIWTDRFPWRFEKLELGAANVGRRLIQRFEPASAAGMALARLLEEVEDESGLDCAPNSGSWPILDSRRLIPRPGTRDISTEETCTLRAS